MSTPYERMLRSVPARPPPRPPREAPASSSRPPTDGTTTLPAAQAANAKKTIMVKKRIKPQLPFFVRPRFRFDLPEPPMDPKMLMGTLSTASYAKPFLSDLEREFRPVITPADPSHALRANLVTPAVPRPASARRHRLTIDDDALLQSVMNVRPGASKGGDGLHLRSGSGGVSSLGVSKPKSQASNVSNAPWMRRMSYDEYFARSGTGRIAASARKTTKTLVQQDKELLHDPVMKQRRRKLLFSTFSLSRKTPVYPDLRKGHLKPVNIAPIFPDFGALGDDFISLDFDFDETLTVEHRAKNDAEGTEESIRTMATVSLAEGTARRDEKPKKFIACYTPTDETLDKRKRKRDETGEEDEIEVKLEDDIGKVPPKKKKKKLHLVEDEPYAWFGEYAIREGKFGAAEGGSSSKVPTLARSCFAVTEHASKDNSKHVACFKRVNTSWKLARRPPHEASRLGKEGLQITRDFSKSRSRAQDNVKRNLLSGKSRYASTVPKKEGKTLAEILEED